MDAPQDISDTALDAAAERVERLGFSRVADRRNLGFGDREIELSADSWKVQLLRDRYVLVLALWDGATWIDIGLWVACLDDTPARSYASSIDRQVDDFAERLEGLRHLAESPDQGLRDCLRRRGGERLQTRLAMPHDQTIDVAPPGSVLLIGAEGAEPPPTATSRIAIGASVVAVGTRDPQDGPTTVRVRSSRNDTLVKPDFVVFDGELAIPGGVLALFNVNGGVYRRLPVETGRVTLRISTNRTTEPDVVTVEATDFRAD